MELKHVLTFSDFLNEGANGVKGIRVFPPGKKNKPEGTCEAKSLAEWCNKWLQEGLTLVLSVDLDANLDDDEEFDVSLSSSFKIVLLEEEEETELIESCKEFCICCLN